MNYIKPKNILNSTKTHLKILAVIATLAILVISLPVAQAELTCVAAFGSSGTGVGQFNVAVDLAIANNGNVFVVDYNNNHVDVFDSTGTALFKFGTWGANPGQFYQPSGIAADNSGHVYVTSAYYNFQGFNTQGQCILQAGSYGTGDGQFRRPYGIAVDDERIYVTDSQLFRVQVFDKSGDFLFKFGSRGYADGQFQHPNAIDVDNNGQIYVLDASRCLVQVFDSTGGFLYKFGSQGSGDNQFYSPSGIAIDDSGNIYVSNHGYSRVQVYDSQGNFLYKFGSYGTAIGQFRSPRGLEVVSNGDIYVPDGVLNRVQKFSSNIADTTAPQSTITLNPGVPTGNNDWYTTPVAISITATDNTDGTGVATITYTVDNASPVTLSGATAAFTLSTEGIHTVSYYATDNSNNQEAAKTDSLKIDLTAPTITATKTPAANTDGWNNGDVTVTFTVSDAVSGLALIPADQVFSSEGAGQYVIGTAVDMAGNTATLTVGDVNIDKTAPSITATPSTLPNQNGWYNADVVVQFIASDALSGVVGDNSKDIAITSEGINQQATWTATDLAGNTYTCTLQGINIDKTAPTTTYTIAGDADSDGWYTSNAELTLTASDATSGVSGTYYSQDGINWTPYQNPIAISSEGTTTISYYSTDNAGNAEPIQSIDVNIAYSVTFTQTGLPTGTEWSVTLDSATQSSTSNTITFKVKPGSYSYIISEIAASADTKYIPTQTTGTLNIPTQLTLNAAFQTQYYITVQANPTASATVSPVSGWYDAGASIAISATPNSGYVFYSWTSSTPAISFASVNTAQTTATINGAGTITATVPYIVDGNKHVTLTGDDNVLIVTGGNNKIDATQATSTTIIKTGVGNNKISLGEGNNVFISTADGNDHITTGNGDNTITVNAKGNLKIATGNGNDIITINGKGNNQINAGNGDNQVTVNDGNNQITTGKGNDVIVAGNGNNQIQTGAGNDQITVGDGNNKIDGGAGTDAVIVGSGKNKIVNCEN